MKFFALFAIFALVIATVVCEHELDPRCPQDESEESPAVFIAHESDCTKYYACTNGRSYEMDCPLMVSGDRLHWDAVESVCNWPAAAKCNL